MTIFYCDLGGYLLELFLCNFVFLSRLHKKVINLIPLNKEDERWQEEAVFQENVRHYWRLSW